MGLKTTSFNIEEKDYELLKDKAFSMKKRVSDILRDLVSDFIKVEKTEQEKSKEKIKKFFNYLDNLEEVSEEEAKEIDSSIKKLTREEIDEETKIIYYYSFSNEAVKFFKKQPEIFIKFKENIKKMVNGDRNID